MAIPPGLPALLVSVGALGVLLGLGRGLERGLSPRRCPNCEKRLGPIRWVARFCPHCGQKLQEGLWCSECKILYPRPWKFCPVHGTPLEEKPEEGEERPKPKGRPRKRKA
jgi:hypothetical protein